MSHINWKEALAKAGIAGGLVFLGSLQAVGSITLPVLQAAAIAGGIAFLSVLKAIEERDTTTTTG